MYARLHVDILVVTEKANYDGGIKGITVKINTRGRLLWSDQNAASENCSMKLSDSSHLT